MAVHRDLGKPRSVKMACGSDERVVYNQPKTMIIKEPKVLVILESLHVLGQGTEHRPPTHLVLISKV